MLPHAAVHVSLHAYPNGRGEWSCASRSLELRAHDVLLLLCEAMLKVENDRLSSEIECAQQLKKPTHTTHCASEVGTSATCTHVSVLTYVGLVWSY